MLPKLCSRADNIELYRQLLDLSAQALDLQAENGQLKEELHELKKKQDLEDKIIRHGALFLQLKDPTGRIYVLYTLLGQ